jgi:putative ABC transport system permease protein
VLRYSLRDLARNGRRTLASVVGVALGVGLFASIGFFIDGSAASMTSRAVAAVPLDMQAVLNAPLAAGVALKESVAGPASPAAGQTVTITLTVTNLTGRNASGVVVRDEAPAPLTYVPGTTTADGRQVPDDEEGRSQLAAGVSAGTLGPRATATVTYAARTTRPIASLRELALRGSVTTLEDPVPADANAPPAITADELLPAVGRLRDVAAVDRLSSLDLPSGSLRAGGNALPNPVRVLAFDDGYRVRYPGIGLTAGAFAPGAAVLSVEAARTLGVRPGASIELGVPGRAQPLPLPVSGVADLSSSPQLFASRDPDSLGDFLYAPHVVVLPTALFDGAVLPALRVDAGSPGPLLRIPPVVELDVRLDRSSLASDPATALRHTMAVHRSIERIAPGQVAVVDGMSDALTVAQSDAIVARVLFLFLGLPGVLLAACLAGYVGSLLARAQRREQATLRLRGAETRHLTRLLAYNTAWIAGLGSLLGIGLGFAAMALVFGPGSLRAAAPESLALSALLAVAAGVLATALGLYLPGRRALASEVAEERRELGVATPPAWLRFRLDFVLLGIAALVEAITFVSGGFAPRLSEATQGETVSLSFYMLLAPLAAWFGSVLLAARLFLLAAGRIPMGGRFGSAVAGTLRRSVGRRAGVMVAGIVTVALAQAFGVGTAVFAATYHAEKSADARFVVGSDLRVTPSPVDPRPADFASRLEVPGAAAAAPVVFHLQNATVGSEAKDMALVDPARFERAAYLPDSFLLDGSAAAAMAALRADPAGLLIDAEAASAGDIQVGDTVKVLLKDASGGDVAVNMHALGRFRQMPGFPQHADLVGNLAYYQGATGITSVDFFVVRAVDPGPAGVARAADAIRAGPGSAGTLRIDTTAHALNRDQSTLTALDLNGLATLDLLFVALMSAAGIGIFVFGLLLQRPREYMTMRALGMRARHVHGLLIAEAVVVAAVALPTAAIVGTAMALMFVQVLRPVFTLPPDRLTFPTDWMASLAALVICAMAASTLAGSLLLRRLRPIELLREE